MNDVRKLTLLALVLAILGGPSCSTQSNPPVVVIGLDGADWDLLLPWLEQGELPNLKAFLENAMVGDLETVLPILSPVCWTSAVTGVNPGKHGIFDFQKIDPQSRDLLMEQASSRRATPVWMLLSDAGYSNGIMNVPMTYPPDPVKGRMVSGFHFPASDDLEFTYPPKLKNDLTEYPLDKLGLSLYGIDPQDMLLDLYAQLDARGTLAEDWLQSGDHDFLWLVFTATDRVQHFFWKFMDPDDPNHDPEQAKLFGNAILDVWKRQDEILGRLLAALPSDATVVLLSDHGFDGVRRQVNMGNWIGDTDLPNWLKRHAIPP
jgi:predicted AlkP superfamily phosphohydrolase/phosphomutase